MSGGTFEYNQYRLSEIRERIEEEIVHAIKPRPPKIKEVWISDMVYRVKPNYRSGTINRHWNDYCTLDSVRDYYIRQGYEIKDISDKEFHIELDEQTIIEVRLCESEKYIDDCYYPDYSKETIKELKKAVKILKKAEIYTQRIDYLIAGDDSEESFHERLQEELKRKIK